MSYHIYRTESNGFGMKIKTQKERKRFLDFSRHLLVWYISYLDKGEYIGHAKTAREAYSEIWDNVRDFDDTVRCVREFLEKIWTCCPFKLDLGFTGYVGFEFNFDYDGIWHADDEIVFIEAFAPFAEEGAFIGFEGEDNDLWSYVYDGKGGYQRCDPKIDWTHGFVPPAKDEGGRSDV